VRELESDFIWLHSLMDAYDGNIEVEDNEPEGSVFVVQFHVAS